MYYLDGADHQSSWHPDVAKARRFPDQHEAMDVLDQLLDGDERPYIDGEYDVLQIGPAGQLRSII